MCSTAYDDVTNFEVYEFTRTKKSKYFESKTSFFFFKQNNHTSMAILWGVVTFDKERVDSIKYDVTGMGLEPTCSLFQNKYSTI